MKSKEYEYTPADAFNKIYAILEELNAEIENLPGNVKTVPLFRKIDKIYDCLQYLKFSGLNFK